MIPEHFQLRGKVRSLAEYGEGHINTTSRVEMEDGRVYLLQSVNTSIFQDPDILMDNIRNVTEYLRKKIEERGGDPERETLRIVPTVDGKPYYRDENGAVWRMYPFITDTVTYQSFDDPVVFKNCGEAFGRFLADLDGYPAQRLHEVIPDFHNTRKRYRNLLEAAARDVCGRRAKVQTELAFAAARSERYGWITDALEQKEIPLRVTHNDTKVNNVLMDARTGEGICVIDLDTVMPGSCLYDFGDAIRFGAATAPEDVPEGMGLDTEWFEAFTDGYIHGAGGRLTEREIEALPLGAWMMTMECGIRFLTDYLEGDTYFKIHRPEHNLDRARAQFTLAADMERRDEELSRIVKKYRLIPVLA